MPEIFSDLWTSHSPCFPFTLYDWAIVFSTIIHYHGQLDLFNNCFWLFSTNTAGWSPLCNEQTPESGTIKPILLVGSSKESGQIMTFSWEWNLKDLQSCCSPVLPGSWIFTMNADSWLLKLSWISGGKMKIKQVQVSQSSLILSRFSCSSEYTHTP